jgi:tRNA nucleotidyltransferase (CCA-adding enzyme)
MIQIQIPEKAKYIIETIQNAGFEAYVVGGCVRDSILGRCPEDWDITTSARPEQVKALFRRTIDTGIQHGTVTVMLDKEGFEVTTYRVDGKYEDSRHPKEVTFTPNLEEDLKRRDFTINAMAYNETEGLIDIFGGLQDIEAKLIRCVGNPEERFGEDALRIMRAIRFSAQLGYEIHEDTEAAIRKLAPTLQKISAERVQVELTKLLISPHPDTLRDAYDMGVTKVILPEFDAMMKTPQKHKHHKYNVGEHTLHALIEIAPEKNLRYAILLHDIGKPETLTVDEDGTTHFHGHPAVGEEMARRILRRLRFDNDTVAVVTRLVRYHDYGNDVTPDLRIVRRAVNKIGEDIFPLLFPVRQADILAQSDYLRAEKLKNLELWKQLYEEMLEKKQCVSLKTLAVTGRDLIAMGMKPGRELGDMLQKLLELVLEHPEQNTREQLLEKAGKAVVIDHHRRAVDSIQNPTLNYLEAGSSSACEMVTEVIQYFDDGLKPTTFECGALLAGITMDTKHFSFNTGARTFEAASYLRRNGADNTTVKMMFQDDMQTYRNRAKVVENAIIMEQGIAISACPAGMEATNLIAAQAADELVNIKGIQASFVLAERGQVIYISGRSLGDISVQLILEKLGGGGHQSIAGAQLKDVTMDEAISRLTESINSYLKEAHEK